MLPESTRIVLSEWEKGCSQSQGCRWVFIGVLALSPASILFFSGTQLSMPCRVFWASSSSYRLAMRSLPPYRVINNRHGDASRASSKFLFRCSCERLEKWPESL